MKKIVIIFLIMTIFLMSCSSSIKFVGEAGSVNTFEEVEWYGIANKEEKRDDVIYKISPESVIVAILLSETIVVPIILVGWCLYEPIEEK